MITLRKVDSGEELKQYYAIRKEVFQDELHWKPGEERDKYDGDSKTHHILITLDEIPAGGLRWREAQQSYKIERFCILKEHRKKGLATEVIQAIIQQIPNNLPVLLMSPEHLIRFFEKSGFTPRGGTYWEGGMVHKPMKLRQSKR